MVQVITGLRKRFPTWGPKKLEPILTRRGYAPPAPSTIGDILRREGLVGAKRRKSRPGSYADGLSPQDQPPVQCREPEYGSEVLVYRVQPDGTVLHEGKQLFISSVLRGKPIGLTKQPDDSWNLHYGPVFLGSVSRTGRITRGHKHRRKRRGSEDELPAKATA